MPRIRTVKPELWEDEVVGLLPRDARLLFISTFNMADDEGILRWTPAYIKAQTFMYDDDLNLKDVDLLMGMLAEAGLVFPYIGGVARQQMAVVVNFRKHQKINRPQKSKLPPPSLQNYKVREMYARRDGWICQLCGLDIPRLPVVNDAHNLSIDHITPQTAGGSDHPSNLRATHQACNKGRRDSPDGEEFFPPQSLAGIDESVSDALSRSVNGRQFAMNGSLNGSVNESHAESTFGTPMDAPRDISSLNHSLTEGKGREGKGKEGNTPLPPGDRSAEPAVAQTGERPIADRMTDAFLDRFARGNSYKRRQVRQVIADTLANDTDPTELWKALERLGSLSKPISAGTLQFAFSEIRKPSNVIALPGYGSSTTDARVQAALDLGRQMQAEYDAAHKEAQ
jgi:hypothetical protein